MNRRPTKIYWLEEAARRYPHRSGKPWRKTMSLRVRWLKTQHKLGGWDTARVAAELCQEVLDLAPKKEVA